MTKKVVICSNTSWSLYNFRLNLSRAIRDGGFDVVLVAPYDEYSDRLAQEFKYHSIIMNNKGTNPVEDMKTTVSLYKLYNKIKPDFVLNFTIKPNIYGNIACSLLGVKTINNISGLGTVFVRESLVTKVVKRLYKYSLSKSSKVFFQNRDDFDIFVDEKLVDIAKCDILPGSGVDTQKFKHIKVEKKDNVFRFLLVARMLWDKGIGEYIEAAKIIKQKYKNIEFLLLGAIGVDNPTAISKEIIEKWEQEGIIKYLGTTDDVKSEITKTDCIVLPSYREGTSRVLLESAAMAKPMITTDVPGCRNVVNDGVNGYLCEVRNAKDLAHKMEMMLNLSEEERILMGQKGREKMIAEFDEKIVIKKYLESIERLL